jgi:hypothetical protein
MICDITNNAIVGKKWEATFPKQLEKQKAKSKEKKLAYKSFFNVRNVRMIKI